MSDTPRTDAAAIRCACSTYVVPSEFARELERENAALRAAIKRIHKEWGRLVHAEDNLDDAIWKALAAAEKEAQP